MRGSSQAGAKRVSPLSFSLKARTTKRHEPLIECLELDGSDSAFSHGYLSFYGGTTPHIVEHEGERILGLLYRPAEKTIPPHEIVEMLGADERHPRMDPKRSRQVSPLAGGSGLVISRSPITTSLTWQGEEAAREAWAKNYERVRGVGDTPYAMDSLRARARELGISPLPRSRQGLQEAIEAKGVPEHPHAYPAWSDRSRIVLRGEDISGKVMDHLAEVGRDGFLALERTKGGELFLFDSRDEPASRARARAEQWAFHDEWMERLEPVKQELKARGHSWFALGNPSLIRDKDGQEEVRFWLNGSGSPELGYKQPFGWYTLEELSGEKFVEQFRT